MSDLVRIATSEPTLSGARPLLAVLESLWPVAFIDRPGAGATASIVDAAASPQVDALLTLHMPTPSESSADGIRLSKCSSPTTATCPGHIESTACGRRCASRRSVPS